MIRKTSLLVFLVAFSVFIFQAGFLFAQEGPAPDFTLKNLEGKDVTLSSMKGKVIILDFWAVYCPPCRDEIPGFIDIYKTYKDKGVEVIGISVDRDASKVKTFVESNQINYPILLHSKEVLEAYGGIQAIPTTFILDKELKIVEKHVGFAEKSVFEEKVKSLLKTSPVTLNTASGTSQPASSAGTLQPTPVVAPDAASTSSGAPSSW